ncbi:MAG: hypothetical protein U0R49_06440 [Fimbriimonadales bacterium]
MKRDVIYVTLGLLCLGAYAVAGLGGQQNTQSLPIVFLQNSTPGTPQTGHTNISGTSKAGQFVGGGSGLINVNADLLDGLDSTAFLQAVPNPLFLTGSQPGSYIIRAVNSSSTNNSYAILGESHSGTGFTYGVNGESNSTSGRGVSGSANATTGLTFGGTFVSYSSSGVGVHGASYGPYAVVGQNYMTSGTAFGGWFDTDSTSGRGVYANANSPTGLTYGGYFVSDSTSGYGVYAETAGTYGVYGVSNDTSGTVYGARFVSQSPNGRGVYGENGTGGATDTPYGVRGFASTATLGYGVYAVGDLGASGVKSFRIDHPLDPENKYLLHYASESPFPQNFYNGNVTTDASGRAWVELPAYFSEINTNFKYQLTIVDDSESAAFVQAKVGRKIQGNRFLIMTSAPNVEVSWEVKADRNDLRIRHNRPTDVREKGEGEKGKYQHPEYYGLGPEMGMDYDPELQKRKTGKSDGAVR